MIRFNFFRLATRYSPQSAQSTRCTGGAAINSIVSEEERVKEDLTLLQISPQTCSLNLN